MTAKLQALFRGHKEKSPKFGVWTRSSSHCPESAMHWSAQDIRPAPPIVLHSTTLHYDSTCISTLAVLWNNTTLFRAIFFVLFSVEQSLIWFQKFGIFSSFKTLFTWKGYIGRSKKGRDISTENDAGHSYTFRYCGGIFRTFANLPTSEYRRLNRSGFPQAVTFLGCISYHSSQPLQLVPKSRSR